MLIIALLLAAASTVTAMRQLFLDASTLWSADTGRPLFVLSILSVSDLNCTARRHEFYDLEKQYIYDLSAVVATEPESVEPIGMIPPGEEDRKYGFHFTLTLNASATTDGTLLWLSGIFQFEIKLIGVNTGAGSMFIVSQKILFNDAGEIDFLPGEEAEEANKQQDTAPWPFLCSHRTNWRSCPGACRAALLSVSKLVFGRVLEGGDAIGIQRDGNVTVRSVHDHQCSGLRLGLSYEELLESVVGKQSGGRTFDVDAEWAYRSRVQCPRWPGVTTVYARVSASSANILKHFLKPRNNPHVEL
ncbi:uncharacterized protein V1518DRAFT_458216 [Limtongia smithiae]|uniref:uncharacterized protein n=1 Tax=Limtongia smithiae TaxID=1125753 RepID=UPI0034CD1BB3